MIIICVQNTSLDRNLEQSQAVDESVVVLIEMMLLIQEDLALDTSPPFIFRPDSLWLLLASFFPTILSGFTTGFENPRPVNIAVSQTIVRPLSTVCIYKESIYIDMTITLIFASKPCGLIIVLLLLGQLLPNNGT